MCCGCGYTQYTHFLKRFPFKTPSEEIWSCQWHKFCMQIVSVFLRQCTHSFNTFYKRWKKGYPWIFDKKICHLHKYVFVCASINRNKLNWNKACRHESFNSSSASCQSKRIFVNSIENAATTQITHVNSLHKSIAYFSIFVKCEVCVCVCVRVRV